MRLGLGDPKDAAVDHDRQLRQRRLQAIHAVIVQRRHVAVLLRRQALQPGFTRMHDQHVDAGVDHGARQRIERQLRILIVDADPALHRHRHAHRALHRSNAFGNQLRLRHQAGAEAAVLDPVRWAADVEIDLVVAELLADRRRMSEIARVRAAELQRHRMFAGVESKQPLPIAMDHRARRHHFAIEQCAPAQHPMEDPTMPVGPIHHRRDGKSIWLIFLHFRDD